VARLRALGCPVVLGNADALLFGTGPADGRGAIRAWTRAQLSAAGRTFLRALPPTLTRPLAGGRRRLCFHGSPASYDDAILPGTPEEEFRRLLAAHTPQVLAGGHTHLAQLRPLDDTFFCNPGSVGYPAHRPAAWAEYAVLTADGARGGGVPARAVRAGTPPPRARHSARLSALLPR